MYYTKAKVLKSLFPFTLHLLNRERTLIGHLLYTVSRRPSNLGMLILPIFDFFPNWQSIKNIVYWLWIFLVLKHIPIQWKVGISLRKKWDFSIVIFSQKGSRLQKMKGWDCRLIWNFNKMKLKDWTKNTT